MWRSCVLLVLLSLVRGAAPGQGVCPWLTQGTAAALMGGDVSAEVQGSAGEGSCEFARGEGGNHPERALASSLEMKIVVGHVAPKECATGERLTGIGEDAVFCRVDQDGEHRQAIRGRVRSTYFLLTLTVKGGRTGDKAVLRRSLEQAAEGVAGNLF